MVEALNDTICYQFSLHSLGVELMLRVRAVTLISLLYSYWQRKRDIGMAQNMKKERTRGHNTGETQRYMAPSLYLCMIV